MEVAEDPVGVAFACGFEGFFDVAVDARLATPSRR